VQRSETAPRQWIVNRLGPPSGRRFALLDSTRDPLLNRWLLELPRDLACPLWPSPLTPGLLSYAPFVLDLSLCADFIQRWSGAGVDAHWGLLVDAEADLPQMQRHFSPFTHLRQGRQLKLCRFYDPRVFAKLFTVYSTRQKHALLPGWVKCVSWTDFDALARLRLRRLHNRGPALLGLRPPTHTLEDCYATDA
jgi:hypothetical protein